MKNKLLTVLILLGIFIQINSQTYKDYSKPIEDRVEDLLSKMTLKEKIGQMQQTYFGKLNDVLKNKIIQGEIGSFLNAGNRDDKIELQKIAVNKSRLGIPLIFGRDVIHGYKTIFPIPLGQAASWNEDLIQKASSVAAREAAEAGIDWTFAPMIDISRDARWGRIAESFGEDPYLTSILSSAAIKGYQGKYLNSYNSIAACAKHFVGYGAAEGGRDYNTTLIPENELRNIYLQPFHAAVNTGVATLMSAFNDLNGVPASGNYFTLKNILRDEWNFDGFVLSDWDSIIEMVEHGFTKNNYEAALMAVNAGINMEMASTSYAENLKKLISKKLVSEEWIDKLVGDILRIKFKLGLFENPFPHDFNETKTLSNEHKEIAKELATESIVMLKNLDKTLPINSEIKSLAIIGPLADSQIDQLGTWVPDGNPEDAITPLKTIKESFKDFEINFAKGIESPRSNDKSLFPEALEAVNNSDLTLLFLGEDYLLSGETHCRAFIDLPGAQEDLISYLSESGKPIVLIIMAGRPLTIGNIEDKVQSILYIWNPGTMGGPAIADILLGKVSPSGKLPVTFPRAVGQIPLYYNHRNTGRPPEQNQLGRKLGTPENPEGFASFYLDVDITPAYEFGYGLSYAEFNYSYLELSSDKLSENNPIRVKVNLENNGKIKAKETVQLYIRDNFASITRPVKELKKFQKVELSPHENENIEFIITVDDLRFYNINNKFKYEPGEFEIYVGSSSRDSDLLKDKFILE